MTKKGASSDAGKTGAGALEGADNIKEQLKKAVTKMGLISAGNVVKQFEGFKKNMSDVSSTDYVAKPYSDLKEVVDKAPSADYVDKTSKNGLKAKLKGVKQKTLAKKKLGMNAMVDSIAKKLRSGTSIPKSDTRPRAVPDKSKDDRGIGK